MCINMLAQMGELSKMNGKGKGQMESEEKEIRDLFLGIMGGYNDAVIPPFSYFSPASISENGSSSRKREEDQDDAWAENLLKERKKRMQMNEKFSVLQSMVPSLFIIHKPSREQIVNETVKYIKNLEQEMQRLEGLRKQLWQESEKAKPLVSKCRNQKSSVDVTILRNATFLAVELPFRGSLMAEIVEVLDRHRAEVLEARFYCDEEKFSMFSATLMLRSNEGSDDALVKMKEELMAL